jgi:DNA polymerase III epsilon subunit family exonuclease
MKQTNRFWRFVFITLLASMAAIAAVLLFFWQALNGEQSLAVISIFKDYPLYILTLFFICAGASLAGLEIIFHSYIKPLKKISDEASMIYSTNPSHRLSIKGIGDVTNLSSVINDFAEVYENHKKEIAEQIFTAGKEIEKERNLLASIMAELPQGVIICNRNGRILLFNSLAKKTFTQDAHSKPTEHFIGLGRSIFRLIDKGLLAHAVEEIEECLYNGNKSVGSCFVTRTHTDHQISIETTPVLDQENQMTGFILTFQDESDDINQYDTTHAENNSPGKKKHRAPVITGSRPEFYDFDLFGTDDDNRNLLDTPLDKITYTVFDTETTGLSPDAGDEIISIAAVRIVNSRIVYQDIFEELIDPKRDIPFNSYKIHGINDEMVRGKKSVVEVLPVFKQFASNTVFLGHNIAFDMKMLKVKEKVTNIKFSNPVLDTLLLSAFLHPFHDRHDMENIARRLGINIVGRHTAKGDAIAAAEIFLKLLPVLNRNGILTLKDAVMASKKTYYARLNY